MLYVVSWTIQTDHRNAAQARFKETGGMPPEGVEMLGRWHSVEGNRGLCIAKSDDAVAVAKWAQAWSDVLSFDIYPVLDDEDFSRMLG